MAYENIPAENAPALAPRVDEYKFIVDIDGILPNGDPRATIDDLELLDPAHNTGAGEILNFLDRVVVKVTLRDQVLTTPITIQGDGDTSHVDQRVEGVRGKKIPLGVLKHLYLTVGEAMKNSQTAGN